MSLPIYVYGNEVLREEAKNLDINNLDIRKELDELIPQMFATMEQADGVGLAAPQIGRSIKLLVVDGTVLAEDMPELKEFKKVMINPQVLWESEETVEYSEGCLSVPDIHADVVRSEKIRVKYINANYQEVTEEFSGFGCRMVQHELDHLKGILFTDKISPIRKKLIQGKLNNIVQGKIRTSYRVIKKNKK